MNRPRRLPWLTVFGIAAIVACCDDDPQSASGDELPLVDGASVIQKFEVPHPIVEAQVLFQVVAGEDGETAAELVDDQRALLEDEGWQLRRDDRAQRAWYVRASDDHVEDFIRFGTVGAMKVVAMSRSDRRHVDVAPGLLARSMIVMISPPGPSPPD